MLAYSGRGSFVVKHHDLSEIVREMGQMLDVSVSENAPTALVGLKVFKIHEKKIACVFLDLTMPEMDDEEAFLKCAKCKAMYG